MRLGESIKPMRYAEGLILGRGDLMAARSSAIQYAPSMLLNACPEYGKQRDLRTQRMPEYFPSL